MKKIIILSLLFFGVSFSAFSQKPMIGLSEKNIIRINRAEFGIHQKFEKQHFLEDGFWTLHTIYDEVICMYYFNYDEEENFLFSMITDDYKKARQLYEAIEEKHISINETTFMEERSGFYIKFTKSDNGNIIIIWSIEYLKD